MLTVKKRGDNMRGKNIVRNNQMKRTISSLILPLILIGSIFLGCSGSHVKYIKENPDFLKPGLYARAFLEAWGQPDKVMAYQDFRDKQYSHVGYISGSSKGFSGFSSGQTYTPTTVVWIYSQHNKVLFFQQVSQLLGLAGKAEMVWKLVGWENLTSDQTTRPQISTPGKPITSTPPPVTTTIVTVTWTSANIRSGVGNNHPVVKTVRQGDKLTVIGESGDWFNVRLEAGKEGWINSRVVK